MTATCPTCGKAVDTLRSRFVKVRGIQVVAYCSAECLAQAEPSVPVAIPKIDSPPAGTVKPGVAPDSGPVIEIRYEPASGVVTSAPDQRTPTGPVPKVEPDIPKVDLIKLKKQEQKEKEKEKSDKVGKKTEPEKTAAPAPKKPEPAPKAKSEPKLAVVKAEPEKPKPETPDKPVDKKKLAVVEQTSTPKGGGTSLVGPRKRGRETMQRDRSNVDQSEDWLDDEPANVGAVRAGTDLGDIAPVSSGSGKRVLVTLLVVALLAGGGVLAYQLTRGKQQPKSTPSASGSDSQPAPPPGGSGSGSSLKPRIVGPLGSQSEVEPPAVDPLAKATGILKRYLETKDSPRIQRKAAMAWVRTGEKAAVDRLATALADKDLEQAGRLEIAYYLARAGDKRGLDVLYASLAAPRRDDKLVGARMLTELGDKRAVDTLASYLDVPQNRLGAADLLAKLGDPRGLKVLEQIRADDKASAEDKATATIALGYAGKDVTEDLHKLLADPRFNKFAADALAARHDEAARATLVKQLDVTGLRVESARALRRLSPDGDFTSYVKKLMAALDDPTKQRDTEQIPTAEAILLLAGPAKWADRA